MVVPQDPHPDLMLDLDEYKNTDLDN